MEGLCVAMLGRKIELGWLVPNKMLYLISLWEIFDVWATAIRDIYLKRYVLLEQKSKEGSGVFLATVTVHWSGTISGLFFHHLAAADLGLMGQCPAAWTSCMLCVCIHGLACEMPFG
jgi:hypothetical protein